MSTVCRILVWACLAAAIPHLSLFAQEPVVEAAEIVVAAGLDPAARQPIAPAAVFPDDIDRVFCYTRIRGAETPTTVTHVWYLEGETMARVELPVRSPDWRTWSSKRIMTVWRGNWQVKILDDEGLVLGSTGFRVVPSDSLDRSAPDPEGAEE